MADRIPPEIQKAISQVAAGLMDANPLPSNLMSIMEQVLMYIGTVLGVVTSFVFKDGFNKFDPTGLSWSTFLAACLISIVIIPAVFAKVQVDSKVPFVVRFGLCVQNGVFWQVLMNAAGNSGA